MHTMQHFIHFLFCNAGIKACMAAMEPVSEEQFEIGIDIHGVNNSPRFGRLRVMNKVSLSLSLSQCALYVR